MSDGIMLSIGDDGIAREYDDTYDITIHCESREEQEEVRKAIENIPRWIPCSERLPSEPGSYLTTYTGFMADHDVCILAFIKDGEESRWSCSGEVHAWMKHPDPYEGEVTK